MVRLLSLALYLLSECLFLLGAGRECEGKNHREREVLAYARVSPLPKVLPLALPLSLSSPL